MRALCLWLSIYAIVLAPILVDLTHAVPSAMAVDEITFHGQSHGDEANGYFPSHDATDHEHQIYRYLPQSGGVGEPGKEKLTLIRYSTLSGAISEGPRRPPRVV